MDKKRQYVSYNQSSGSFVKDKKYKTKSVGATYHDKKATNSSKRIIFNNDLSSPTCNTVNFSQFNLKGNHIYMNNNTKSREKQQKEARLSST